MGPLVPIMMFGWIPVVIGLFLKLPPRRAVITSFLFAWLFLPVAAYPLPGLPDYTKMSATCWGVLIAAAIFDSERLITFRPRLIDVPMLIWCICPLISSLANGLGLYDGVASLLTQTVTWGFPYLIGRIYFNDLEGLKEFAIGIFIGGIIYMPLCWYEIRMSPQLHNIFYGFMQRSFAQTMRYGGYRPMVFMEHGLMVGIWMMSASLIGIWLWASGTVKKILNIQVRWLTIALLITSIFCKSAGALALLAVGAGTVFLTLKLKKRILIILLILVPVLYIGTRATGYWSGNNLLNFIYYNIDQERAASLYARFSNEDSLSQKAMIRPVFGWGGWGRSRIYDEFGNDLSVTDGLWIIMFGRYGFVGIGALTLSILLPVLVLMKRYNIKLWFRPETGCTTVLSIILGLYMIDNLLNAMINPIFIVAAGGITGIIKESFEKIEVPDEESWQVDFYQPRYL